MNPGDRFSIQFEVTVDPDLSGQSSTLSNQATIQGADPNAPSIMVFDESDSGSVTGTTNPGQPGDLGTTDDPTPLEIAEIGVAKRVTNVELQGLSSLVTIELTVENTGTVSLADLDLFDDLAIQFGDNFQGIAGAPQILTSTANVDPTLNSGYANDVTQNMFDGASGTLDPGQKLTVRLVVRVSSDARPSHGGSGKPSDSSRRPRRLIRDADSE